MSIRKIIKNPFFYLLIHYLAWILLYVLSYLPILVSATNSDSRFYQWEHLRYDNILLGSVNFALFALVAFVLIPHYFIKKRKWGLLIVLCFISATFFCYFKYNLDKWHAAEFTQSIKRNLKENKIQEAAQVKKTEISTPTTGSSTAPSNSAIKQIKPGLPRLVKSTPLLPFVQASFRTYFFINIWYNIVIIFMAFGYVMLIQWFLQEGIRRRLESEKLTAELSFLKMQINPHFLFNTLNNIYSLSLKKSDNTPDSILKLSDMMRYMLYEKEDAEYHVPLNKEIKYLENFIALQKLRYSGEMHMSFEIKGDTANQKICPLILVPFVENAFKHGVLNDAANPLSIQLTAAADNKLIFEIRNKINNNNKDLNGGIGLVNVKKRLELLYPGRHQLETTETKTHYNAFLTLTS